MRVHNIIALFVLWCSVVASSWSQTDTLTLDDVVITATKTERSLVKVPLPVTLISAKEIQKIASSRLQDILAEQSGLIIVPQINGLGNGVQLQGLNPDYTLILIDGEPIIGRYAGTLELNRITVADIKKIEIVKGPSSSLYGSDALAGVINIITNKFLTNKINVNVKLAERKTSDASIDLSYAKNTFSNQIFFNHFSTEGYDLSKNIYGQTVSPYSNITAKYKLTYEWKRNHEFQFSAKYFKEKQNNEYQVIHSLDSIRVYGNGYITDWSLFPSYQYKFTNKTNIIARTYITNYETKTDLKELESKSDYYNDEFSQRFIRPELQSTCNFSKHQNWTVGVGIVKEFIRTNRYGDQNQRKQQTNYGFLQYEWNPLKNWNLLSGFRYDYNTVYKGQWSPKIAIQYSATKSLSFRASFGTGFKSPDFRQLYLNFNNAAAGYSVFGTENLKSQIEELMSKQLIQELFIPLQNMNVLRPESSTAWNGGITYTIRKHNITTNVFRNDIKDLIETQTVALATNQNFIYSYSNIKRALTQGIEVNYQTTIREKIKFAISYQYLQAKDKDIIDLIKKNQMFGRDPNTLESYRIKQSDYIGLPHRSRHSGFVKLAYTIPKIGVEVNARYIMRGSFGITGTNGTVNGTLINSSDRNSNAIIDKYDNLVAPYGLLNLSLSKVIKTKWMVQLGADNLLNYTDPTNQPTLIGRTAFIKINYKYIQNK